MAEINAYYNNITVISRRSLTQFSTILQLYHGGVYRRFLQNYSYTTSKFNAVFNIITVTSRRSLTPFLTAEFIAVFNNITGRPRRSLTPFSTLLKLYHGGI